MHIDRAIFYPLGTRENYCVYAVENCDAIASLFVLGIEILTIWASYCLRFLGQLVNCFLCNKYIQKSMTSFCKKIFMLLFL